MGQTRIYKCDTCGYEAEISEGIGGLFPVVYKQTLQDAKDGKLGEEVRQFFAEHPDGAINAEDTFGLCEQCREYVCVTDYSMYVPKEGDEHQKFCAEAGYVTAEDLRKHYRLVRRYPHQCEKCNTLLKMNGRFRHQGKLRCPKCGKDMNQTGGLLWD